MQQIYHLRINGQESGPFTLDEVKAKGIHNETYVWVHGMQDWLPADEFPELRSSLKIDRHDAQQAQRPFVAHEPPAFQPNQHYAGPQETDLLAVTQSQQSKKALMMLLGLLAIMLLFGVMAALLVFKKA